MGVEFCSGKCPHLTIRGGCLMWCENFQAELQTKWDPDMGDIRLARLKECKDEDKGK